jgi:carbon monoxide dehydrogenase subunit G
MDLQNSFTVPSDIDTAWKTLLDVERVAPCMPGATLESVDGDEMAGKVKVKLGPVSMVYGGQARFVSRNEETHTAVIEGTGKETRGTGTAKALVTTKLVSEGDDVTRVDVTTDLTITGKAAQFGRGVMQDVAGRIIDQFAGNLAIVMGAGPAEEAAGAGGPEVQSEAVGATKAGTPQPMAADSIDLLGTAGAPVLKRAIPALVGVGIVLALIFWIVRRKR